MKGEEEPPVHRSQRLQNTFKLDIPPPADPREAVHQMKDSVSGWVRLLTLLKRLRDVRILQPFLLPARARDELRGKQLSFLLSGTPCGTENTLLRNCNLKRPVHNVWRTYCPCYNRKYWWHDDGSNFAIVGMVNFWSVGWEMMIQS